MANNKVTIYIHNQRYRFLAEENEDYLQQCADIVNKEMDNAMDGNTLSITDGAVLAAMIGKGGLGEFVYQGTSSNNNTLILLGAIPAALDENARLAKEMSEMKREARKATKEKAKAKREAKAEAKAEAEGKAEDAQPAPAETQEAQTEEST